jgi:hypothetical protein
MRLPGVRLSTAATVLLVQLGHSLSVFQPTPELGLVETGV